MPTWTELDCRWELACAWAVYTAQCVSLARYRYYTAICGM
jgi:hypothetical protein